MKLRNINGKEYEISSIDDVVNISENDRYLDFDSLNSLHTEAFGYQIGTRNCSEFKPYYIDMFVERFGIVDRDRAAEDFDKNPFWNTLCLAIKSGARLVPVGQNEYGHDYVFPSYDGWYVLTDSQSEGR